VFRGDDEAKDSKAVVREEWMRCLHLKDSVSMNIVST